MTLGKHTGIQEVFFFLDCQEIFIFVTLKFPGIAWFGLVTKLCPTLGIPWTVACQAPLSMGFSRQEYLETQNVLFQIETRRF